MLSSVLYIMVTYEHYLISLLVKQMTMIKKINLGQIVSKYSKLSLSD